MKKLILGGILALSVLNANAFDWGPLNAPWLNRDPVNKLSHISLAAPAAFWITKETGCPWVAQGALAAFGMFNELTDLHYNKPDLYSWMAGGAIGAIAAHYYYDKKECGDTIYQAQKYNSLGAGSKAFNATILLGAVPAVSIGTAALTTLLYSEYTLPDFEPTEEWPFRGQNSNLNSYTQKGYLTKEYSSAGWLGLE